MEAGKVSWSDYNELFSYAYGGLKGIGVIVAIHVVINICTLGVSLFLAFSLTKRFSDDGSLGESERQSRDRRYNVVLTSSEINSLPSDRERKDVNLVNNSRSRPLLNSYSSHRSEDSLAKQ